MAVAGWGRGWQRAARAGVMTTASVALGVLAHAATGACVPPGAAVGVAAAVVGASWVLAGSEVHLPSLLAWLGVTQVFVHLVLTVGCADHPGGVAHRAVDHWILAGHVVAVVVTAAALRVAEAGVWAASRLRAGARALVDLLTRLLAPVVVVTLRRPVEVCARTTWVGVQRVDPVLGTSGRRGPPAALLAA